MAQDTSATQAKAKPTYIQMCIIHAEQKVRDIRRIKAHCIVGSEAWHSIGMIECKHEELLDELRLADLTVGLELHRIEQSLD